MTPTAAWSSGRRRALDYDFQVDVAAGGPIGIVEDYLSAFPRLTGIGRSRYRILPGKSKVWRVDADSVILSERASAWRAVALLGWHINQSVVRHSAGRWVLLHAAAAEKYGCSVILPAPMEHGKTTTVTGLVRAGFSYLTDETVAIDPVSLQLTAYPKPLTIDRGAWPLFPDLEPDTVLPQAASWWVAPQRVRADAVIASGQPGLVVMPAYREGSVTREERLGPTEAALELATSTFLFHEAPERNLRTLARLVRTCPVYRLTIGDLPDAVAIVDGLARAAECAA